MTLPAEPSNTVSRRSLAKATAWSVPTITIAATTPAVAASTCLDPQQEGAYATFHDDPDLQVQISGNTADFIITLINDGPDAVPATTAIDLTTVTTSAHVNVSTQNVTMVGKIPAGHVEMIGKPTSRFIYTDSGAQSIETTNHLRVVLDQPIPDQGQVQIPVAVSSTLKIAELRAPFTSMETTIETDDTRRCVQTITDVTFEADNT